MDFDISESLVDARPQETPRLTTVDLDGLLQASPLRIQQNATEGCGGRIWPAGVVLGKYMLRKYADRLEGKHMFVRLRWPIESVGQDVEI